MSALIIAEGDAGDLRTCRECEQPFFRSSEHAFRGMCSRECYRAQNARRQRQGRAERKHVSKHTPEIRRIIMSKVLVVPEGPRAGCWEWTGTYMHKGYGRQHIVGAYSYVAVHVWAYEEFVGPIPEGYELDHLCHTNATWCRAGAGVSAEQCLHRRCLNPAHLQVVTKSENSARGDRVHRDLRTCHRGHAFTEENTYRYIGSDGAPRRRCRTCQRTRVRRWYEGTRQAGKGTGQDTGQGRAESSPA